MILQIIYMGYYLKSHKIYCDNKQPKIFVYHPSIIHTKHFCIISFFKSLTNIFLSAYNNLSLIYLYFNKKLSYLFKKFRDFIFILNTNIFFYF